MFLDNWSEMSIIYFSLLLLLREGSETLPYIGLCCGTSWAPFPAKITQNLQTQSEAEITQPRFAKTILTGNLYEKKLYELVCTTYCPIPNSGGIVPPAELLSAEGLCFV